MGRGGGGGGSRGGGGSHGGSRGFGMHSSGGSHRGEYSGGSHSSYHSSYHSSGYHHHYNSGPTFFIGGSPGMYASHFISKFLTTILIFTFLIIYSCMFSSNSSGDITKSTVEREKLDSSYVQTSSDYYTDNLNWIESAYTLQSGMQNFYEKTGVQPFLYITDNINGDKSGNYSQSEAQTFANKIYDENFSDEGHIVVVFCEYRTGEYVSFYTVGTAAKTVIDDEAGNILLDYIDHYYYSDYDDDEFFAKAFSEAGKRIMTVQKSHAWIVVLAIIALIAIIIIVKFLKKKQKQKSDDLKRAQDILNTPLHEFGDDNVENLAGKYENKD